MERTPAWSGHLLGEDTYLEKTPTWGGHLLGEDT